MQMRVEKTHKPFAYKYIEVQEIPLESISTYCGLKSSCKNLRYEGRGPPKHHIEKRIL